jgi:O-methyltransferase
MARRARSIAGYGRMRLSGDETERQNGGYALLAEARGVLLPGYPLTELMKVWFEDEAFFEQVRRFDPTERSNDRKFFLRELLKLVDHLDGDTAEAGVYEGGSSWLICQARGGRSTHWGFDSFEGLSAPSERDGGCWTAGDLASSETGARALLEPLGAVVLRGWIPEVFAQSKIDRLVFAHVDVDIYDPTLASFEYFYDLLVPGGVIVCDDYGFSACRGAKEAVDEFMADRPENVIHCPTGQGIVIKQGRVGELAS